MKNVLITGVTGFAGSFLAELLLSRNEYQISGTYLSEKSLANVSAIADQLSLHQIDLTNQEAVSDLIKTTKPELIFHLAALPSPAASFKDPAGFLRNNINAELYLLEVLRAQKLMQTRVLIVSSSEVYGLVRAEDIPITEDTSLRPVSPYGVSKIAQDYLGLQYYLAYQMSIIRVRPFGHIGPRLSDQFAASAFAKKIVEIEKGKREPILTVGNLEARRDLTDVRDMMRAYELVIRKGAPGEVYNLGRGTSYQMKEVLDMLLSLSHVAVTVQEDPSLLRPNDIPELRCDNTKMQQLTGWEPTIPLKDSLRDILDYWRNII